VGRSEADQRGLQLLELSAEGGVSLMLKDGCMRNALGLTSARRLEQRIRLSIEFTLAITACNLTRMYNSLTQHSGAGSV
jgi:hypothetical protein